MTTWQLCDWHVLIKPVAFLRRYSVWDYNNHKFRSRFHCDVEMWFENEILGFGMEDIVRMNFVFYSWYSSVLNIVYEGINTREGQWFLKISTFGILLCIYPLVGNMMFKTEMYLLPVLAKTIGIKAEPNLAKSEPNMAIFEPNLSLI